MTGRRIGNRASAPSYNEIFRVRYSWFHLCISSSRGNVEAEMIGLESGQWALTAGLKLNLVSDKILGLLTMNHIDTYDDTMR